MRAKLESFRPLAGFIGNTYMAWKLLSLGCNCPHPAMVVLSESMSPAFGRGDIIILSNWKEELEVGDIPVVWFEASPLPMVHRAVMVRHDDADKQLILTKGDNNNDTDEVLYPPGQAYVYREQVIGIVKGYVPYVGLITLSARELTWLKPLLAVSLILVSVFSVNLR